MVPLQLAEPAAGNQQLLPGGLGGQVSVACDHYSINSLLIVGLMSINAGGHAPLDRVCMRVVVPCKQ
jgi:hypothetical protein